jgi:ABC-type transport system involved in cytochrome bd biosynthesis fused ATPase/permease subunit
MDLQEMRRQVGIVPAGAVSLTETVAENISLLRRDAKQIMDRAAAANRTWLHFGQANGATIDCRGKAETSTSGSACRLSKSYSAQPEDPDKAKSEAWT